MEVTLFKTLFNTDTPYHETIEKVVKRIRDGSSAWTIEKIRSIKDKKERDNLKIHNLPAILFAGVFSERNKAGLASHSGGMVIDFDDFPSKEVYSKMWKIITDNPHIITAFKSPSGNGIKAVVKIPECDSETHSRYFKKFEEEFNYEYFDKSNSDVSRVCFESYDPDIYYNPNAKTYEPELIDKGFSVSEKIVHTPITDEEKIIEKIMSWDWKYDFQKGERNSFTYVLSRTFSEYGVSMDGAIQFITNHFAEPGFTEHEIRNTVRSGYKSSAFGIKKFIDKEKKIQFHEDLKYKTKKEVQEKYDLTDDEYFEQKKEATIEDFWYVEVNSKGVEKIKVDPFKFKIFLQKNGFKKAYMNGSVNPTFVKIQSNIVEETSVERIKDFVLEYLLNKSKISVWSYFASYTSLFSENYLLLLETIELMMLEDERDKSYVAFLNGILEVTAKETKMIDYIDVNGYIWKEHIIRREFRLLKDNSNDYKTFIHNISKDDVLSMETTLGYLISRYKDKSNLKAVIFNDEEISDSPEGGTGKGIIIQGIKQIRKVSILDGKSFDDSKSFPYQTVSKDTDILVFDDVKKNWDFESKFSIVTEGLTLERKGKDAIKLSAEESPKIVVSTNYVIKGSGNSNERRRHEFEISQYYNGERTPYDEFGRLLFDEWGSDDFLRFDNYMVFCLQEYFKNGLIPQANAKNITIRKFIAATNKEFYEWCADGNLPANTRVHRSSKYDAFISEYPDYGIGRYKLSQKSFKIYLDKWGEFNGWEVLTGKDGIGHWTEYTGENTPQAEEFEELPF